MEKLETREIERLTELASANPAEFGREAQRLALAAYEARDWYGVYAWTKSWITSGGGAWTVDAWLLYVVSALLHGQPRSAVHSDDMALRKWIEAPEDRALLFWVRAAVVHRRLNDPKTAQTDYVAAEEGAPSWLRERVGQDADECAVDAGVSRKRKPSVAPAPPFEPGDRSFVAGPAAKMEPGSVPSVWPQLLESLTAPE